VYPTVGALAPAAGRCMTSRAEHLVAHPDFFAGGRRYEQGRADWHWVAGLADQRLAAETGADGYLTKPFSPAELPEAVLSVVRTERAT
jgi:CheY-like chemotaxis protein